MLLVNIQSFLSQFSLDAFDDPIRSQNKNLCYHTIIAAFMQSSVPGFSSLLLLLLLLAFGFERLLLLLHHFQQVQQVSAHVIAVLTSPRFHFELEPVPLRPLLDLEDQFFCHFRLVL